MPPSPRKPLHTAAVAVAGVAVLLSSTAPAAAADSTGAPGLNAAVPALPDRSQYILQIEQATRPRTGGVQFHLYSTPDAGHGERPTVRMGLRTDWYRPISIIGYQRVQGSFFVGRVEGEETAGALSLESRSVLGNIDARFELSYVDGALGTVPLHTYPLSSFLTAPLGGMYRLKGEVREARDPNLIWTRDATWSQPLSRNADGDFAGGQGSLMLTSGSEVRSGPAWLIGKAGIMLTADEIIPVVRAGARFRSAEGGRWEIGISNASELSRQPSVDLRIVGADPNTVSTSLRAEIQKDGRLLPSLHLGAEGGPERAGWHVLVQADRRFLVGVSTAF